ncbi:hypothetical protein A4R44_07407 [Amycolatopsis sp. M39]|nr:hypothetical protein A4R44_07407 [Amycolatopsis sp. M39]
MVIDDQDRTARVADRGDPRGEPAQAGQGRGVQRDQQAVRRREGVDGSDQAVDVEPGQCFGGLVRLAEGDSHARAAAMQHVAEGQRAAEGVRVGADVSEQRHVGGPGQHCGGGLDVLYQGSCHKVSRYALRDA